MVSVMKIFNKDRKVNFVDDNNVFVGFDNIYCCCEQFGWFISEQESDKMDEPSYSGNMDDYNFDTEYFQDVDSPDIYDGGGMVRFRLQNNEGKELFLHLYNSHNGYYSHGFTATINGVKWQDDSL